MFVLFFLVSLLGSITATGQENSQRELGLDKAFKGIGLRTTSELTGDREKVVTLDLLTGARTVAQFSAFGELRSIEHQSRGGRVYARKLMYADRQVDESFDPRGTTIIRTRFTPAHGFQRIETQTMSHGRVLDLEVEVLPSDLAESCEAPPQDFHELDGFLSDVSKINLSTQKISGDDMELSNNFVLKGCRTKNPPNESDGNRDSRVKNMIDEMRSAMQTLVSCLGKPPSAATGAAVAPPSAARSDAAALASLLGSKTWNKKFTVRCNALGQGSLGQGQSCPAPDYPGIKFGPTDATGKNFSGGSLKLPVHEVMIHEMMHVLGYKHFEGMDMAFMVQYCCNKSDYSGTSKFKDTSAKSCDMLGDPAKAGYFSGKNTFDRRGKFWASTEYLKYYRDLVQKGGYAGYSNIAPVYLLVGKPGALTADATNNLVVPMMMDGIKDLNTDNATYMYRPLLTLRAVCKPESCGNAAESKANYALYMKKLDEVYPKGTPARAAIESMGGLTDLALNYEKEKASAAADPGKMEQLKTQFKTAWDGFAKQQSAATGLCNQKDSDGVVSEALEISLFLKNQEIFTDLGVSKQAATKVCAAGAGS